MNAQQEVTPAILTPCVTTPWDRTTAHVKRVLLVMASIVQVRRQLCCCLCLSVSCVNCLLGVCHFIYECVWVYWCVFVGDKVIPAIAKSYQVFSVMAASITFALISILRALCSTVWHWRLLVSHCRRALSRFCAFWLVSSVRRLCSRRFRASRLRWCVALLSHRQVLLGFVHAASEDEVSACAREILVFSRSSHP